MKFHTDHFVDNTGERTLCGRKVVGGLPRMWVRSYRNHWRYCKTCKAKLEKSK